MRRLLIPAVLLAALALASTSEARCRLFGGRRHQAAACTACDGGVRQTMPTSACKGGACGAVTFPADAGSPAPSVRYVGLPELPSAPGMQGGCPGGNCRR